MHNCVILCGGKSSRMGQNKATLKFKDKTILDYQRAKMKEIFNTIIYVSGKISQNYKNVPVLSDYCEEHSPLIALKSVLSFFKDDYVFIMPVDMPNVDKEVIKKLEENIFDYDIIVAKDKFHTHSLCGFFHPRIKEKIDELIKNDIHKVSALFEKVKFNAVYFEDENKFFNMNYLKDYEEFLKDNE